MAIKKDIVLQITYINEKLIHEENFRRITSLDSQIIIEATVKDAYCVVTNVNANKNLINYEITVYENEEKNHIIKSTRHKFLGDISDSAVNYHIQCYNHAKTLTEYIDGLDC